LGVCLTADHRRHPPLLKKLVAPFVDPEVGATMGRVVPYNTQTNLLTRLLDLERRGGYTVDQAVRSAWNLLPQFGGTVGGVRMAAMNEVGGWSAETLAEDTDLTYRLFIAGYSVEYVDDAMCYEESPATWQVRFRQIRRWAAGHNQCLFKYFRATITTPFHPERGPSDASPCHRGRARRCTLARRGVRRGNGAPLQLYKSLGFGPVGIRPNYYVDEGEDAIVMVLDF